MLQVLVDADNVAASRAQPVLDLLDSLALDGNALDSGFLDGNAPVSNSLALELVASGRAAALRRITWPPGARLLHRAGWQRADIALADAYVPSADPLVLITGDGDFGLLAARHPGPVLVISGAPSTRLRESATVVDPAVEGTDPVRAWLEIHR